MSPLFGNAESRGSNAPADRSAEVQRLAIACLQLSHQLRELRDQLAGTLDPDDFDFMTELGVELAAYAAILQMIPDRQIDWLLHTIALAENTAARVASEQGGAV